MTVLILKNARHEGPGTIENFLRNESIGYKIIECSSDNIPQASDFDTLVIMGGPMSVNESEIYPYISIETGLAQEFIKKGKKVLGICLGAQIMAKALGAKVYPGPEKEIGWYDIELQNGGIKDHMMGRLAIHPRAGDFWLRFKVFHWHGETFDIPEGAERLAKSELYPNQAFKYGNHAYAFQFHIEVTKEMIYEWLKNEPVDINTLSLATEMFFDDYTARAENFYRVFFKSTDLK